MMTRSRKLSRCWFLAAPAAAVLLVGCGSGSLSHPQLAARATAACNRAGDSASRLPAPGAGYAGLARYADRLTPIVDRLIGTLDTLHVNATDSPALHRYVSALRAGDRGLTLLEGASSPAQVTQASSLIDSQSIPAVADALGAPACGTSIGIGR
jgi:hypothetical protein